MQLNAFCCKLLSTKHFRRLGPPKSLIYKHIKTRPPMPEGAGKPTEPNAYLI
jgi:hypothetical protein